MSDAARHAAFYVAETNYGETPENPAFKRLRHTGLTLGAQRGSLQSEELRSDRQIADFRLGAKSVGGDIQTELSFGSFDDFLQAVMLGTWAPKATLTGTTYSVSTVDDSINDSGNGFVAAGFEAGDKIAVSGFSDSPNNGDFIIATIAAGKLTLTDLDGNAVNLTTDAAGDAVTITTLETVLKAGTARRSFSVLRHFTDIAATGEGKPYHLFKGVELNTLALAINPTAIITAAFGVLGQDAAAPSNTAPAGSTYAAATTTAPLDGFSGDVLIDGVSVGNITEVSFNLENGLEVRNVVGSQLTARPSIGRSNLTGSLTLYFDDATQVAAFINETEKSLSVELPDGAGNSYVFEVPRFKYTGGQPDVSGQGAIQTSGPFQAVYDTDAATNFIIRKRPAASA